MHEKQRNQRRASRTKRPVARSQAERPAALQIGEVSEGMIVRRLSVLAADVVFVKGIVEASEGLAAVFAEAGGELSIVAPRGRERDLARLVDDVGRELGALPLDEPERVEGAPDA